jgi:hypothetical protein
MKKNLIYIIVLFLCINTFSQESINSQELSIKIEGLKLYQSQMAFWSGSSILFSKLKEIDSLSSGFFSYSDNNVNKFIVFAGEFDAKIITTITFDSTFNPNFAKIDTTTREFTQSEYNFFMLQQKAVKEIYSNTFIKPAPCSSLNIVPVIDENGKRVYIISEPNTDSLFIFGNDYLLTFDKDNNLISKKKIHDKVTIINSKDINKNTDITTTHNHSVETGEFMTPTDVCLLMIYGNYTKWKQHIVNSDNYVSVWNFDNVQLNIFKKDIWDKINK